MNRRSFLQSLMAAAAATPTYVFFGSFLRPQTTLTLDSKLIEVNMTLAEWAKMHDEAPPLSDIVRLLNENQEILADVVYHGAGPFHRWENPNQNEIYGVSPGQDAMEAIEAMNRETERRMLEC